MREMDDTTDKRTLNESLRYTAICTINRDSEGILPNHDHESHYSFIVREYLSGCRSFVGGHWQPYMVRC
jgi:hypothetical protein